MSMMEAVQGGFAKYTSIEGRASRSEFWWFALFCVLATFGSVIGAYLFAPNSLPLVGNLAAVISFVFVVPSITVGVRRLHDTNRSGWHMLWGLVPVAGFVMIVWWMQPGTAGENRFGEDPHR
jgi:uncharacterized membrane protein YhaH (DUF805 family)